VRPITGRSTVVTGTGRLAEGLVDGLDELGVAALPLECGFGSEAEVADALAAVERRLGGIDQIVHTWLAPGVASPHPFMDLDEDAWAAGCEHSLEAAWWLARASAEALRASAGSLVLVVPTVGMAGAAEFTMLAAVAEGVRVLAKGCGRQWGVDGVTVNTIAVAPHHWVDADDADALTRAISLSTPAFGHAGDAADDLAPLVALLDDPDAHFLTAGTLVADGGTWMGL
jgi:NAD(P)-dependent dehydrogenase (short-subunit alcohol dehydrogenase family)